MESREEDLCILVDSAGVPNSCDKPDIPQKDQCEYLEAFGMTNPAQVLKLTEGLSPVYRAAFQGHAVARF